MVPEFCRGCGSKLGVMDRVYCAVAGCQEKARTEKLEALGSMPKQKLLELLAADQRRYEGTSRARPIASLLEAVEVHPWDDCSAFVSRRNAILGGVASPGPQILTGRVDGPPSLKVRASGLDSWQDVPQTVTLDSVERQKPIGEDRLDFMVQLGPQSVTQIALSSHVPFRGEAIELYAPAKVQILGIKLGMEEQLNGTIRVPDNDRLSYRVDMGVARVGVPIVITFENLSGACFILMGSLRGTTKIVDAASLARTLTLGTSMQ